MNLKLSKGDFANLNKIYEQRLEKLKDKTWQISLNSCGCSGDCGTNWMKS